MKNLLIGYKTISLWANCCVQFEPLRRNIVEMVCSQTIHLYFLF